MPFGHACTQTGMQVSEIYAALRTLMTEENMPSWGIYIPGRFIQTKSHCVQWS